MTEFKIGDTVKCIKEYDDNPFVVGLVGKVVGVDDCSDHSQYVSVEYPERLPRGHGGVANCGKEGHCWCIPNTYLEYANQYAVEIL